VGAGTDEMDGHRDFGSCSSPKMCRSCTSVTHPASAATGVAIDLGDDRRVPGTASSARVERGSRSSDQVSDRDDDGNDQADGRVEPQPAGLP